MRLQAYMKAWKYNSSFEVLDRKYLMPFFTLQTEYGNGSRGYSKMSMDLELTDQGKSDESVAHDDNQLETLSSGDEEVDVEGQRVAVEVLTTRARLVVHTSRGHDGRRVAEH